jgi:integrase
LLVEVSERKGKEKLLEAETNDTQRLISAILGWATVNDITKENVVIGMNQQFEDKKRDRHFTDEKVRAFWFGIDGLDCDRTIKLAMKLHIVIGQRPKEICELPQSKVNLDNPVVTIVRESSKNRAEHTVPLPKLAVEILREATALAPGKKYVFAKGASHVEPLKLSVALNRAKDKNGDAFGIANAQLYDFKSTIQTYVGDKHDKLPEAIAILFNQKSARRNGATAHYNYSKYLNVKPELVELWVRHLKEVLDMVPAKDVITPLFPVASKSA